MVTFWVYALSWREARKRRVKRSRSYVGRHRRQPVVLVGLNDIYSGWT